MATMSRIDLSYSTDGLGIPVVEVTEPGTYLHLMDTDDNASEPTPAQYPRALENGDIIRTGWNIFKENLTILILMVIFLT